MAPDFWNLLYWLYRVCYFGCSRRYKYGSFKGEIDIDIEVEVDIDVERYFGSSRGKKDPNIL